MVVKKKLIYILIAIVCLVVVGYFWFSSFTYQNISKTEVSLLSSADLESIPELDAAELSKDEFQKYKDELLLLVGTQGPHIALEKIREEIKNDKKLLRVCHDLVHEIGHEAYEKYGSFGQAMKYQDEICNSGYLHGIIESHFSSSKDIFSTLNKVCADYVSGSFISWECYHGVGHGLMYYTDNDVPRSLELCLSYKDLFASSSCRNGVFMENFNSDQKVHVSKFLKDDNSFYPCTEQLEEDKDDCYFYAPTYYLSRHLGEYQSALQWCQQAGDPYRLTCISGVGSQAVKENISIPKAVEKLCLNLENTEASACIRGMVGLYINHHGSLEPAKQLCEILEPGSKQICLDVVTDYSSLFNK